MYLAQHDVQQVTIEKLCYLLGKTIKAFGDRRVGELTGPEIAAWRITLPAGYRFEATQALRQVLHRAPYRACEARGGRSCPRGCLAA